MANKQMLIDAAEKFINKVETGRARSKETYAEMKAAIEANETGGAEKIPLDAVVSQPGSDGSGGPQNVGGDLRLRTILDDLEGFICSCYDHCIDLDKDVINDVWRKIKEAKKIVW